MIILGINYGHDSSAAIIKNGEIIATVQEERFTRIKHDSSFPLNSIKYCLKEAQVESSELDALAIPFSHGREELRYYFDFNEKQLSESFVPSKKIRSIVKNKLVKKVMALPLYMNKFDLKPECEVWRVDHHLSHAASTYFPSGRKDKTLVFVMDGVGDAHSISIYEGCGKDIELLKSFNVNASLGWFYSCVTEALGWPHGDGEGTTMGLAPYGSDQYKNKFKGLYPEFKNGELVKEIQYGTCYTYSKNDSIQFHMEHAEKIKVIVEEIGRENSAACVQSILEDQAQDIIYSWVEKLKIQDIACSGGVFLNVKMNQNLWYSGKLNSQFIYPDPGDSGLAVGAALYVYSRMEEEPIFSKLKDLYFGPSFSSEEIKEILDLRKLKYKVVESPSVEAAKHLAENKTVAWFQGRMEAGPRALGNRSILMSANDPENKRLINANVKFRQGFRPFCPSVLADHYEDYFVSPRNEEYMVTSFKFKDEKKGRVPAVVHADETGRPQCVKKEINPKYYDLIKHFGDITGEYLILNTSFNIKGEPMICHPKEAIRCFFDNGLDVLILDKYVLEK